MTKAEYLAENSKWLGERTASALDQVPDAQWTVVLAGMQIYGGTDPGIDGEVVVTRETLADFDAARLDHWNERGSRTERTVDGVPALKFERFQMVKGEPRRSVMVVLDLGTIRVSLY